MVRSFRLVFSMRPELRFLFHFRSRRPISDIRQRSSQKKSGDNKVWMISSARLAPISRETSMRKALGVSGRGCPGRMAWTGAPDPGCAGRSREALAPIGEREQPPVAVIDVEKYPLTFRHEDIDVAVKGPAFDLDHLVLRRFTRLVRRCLHSYGVGVFSPRHFRLPGRFACGRCGRHRGSSSLACLIIYKNFRAESCVTVRSFSLASTVFDKCRIENGRRERADRWTDETEP